MIISCLTSLYHFGSTILNSISIYTIKILKSGKIWETPHHTLHAFLNLNGRNSIGNIPKIKNRVSNWKNLILTNNFFLFYFDCLARSFKRVSCLPVGLIWSHEVILVKFLKFDMVIPKNLFSWGKRVCLSLVDQMTYFVWTRKWTYNLAIQKFVLFRSTIFRTKCLKQSYYTIHLLYVKNRMRKT